MLIHLGKGTLDVEKGLIMTPQKINIEPENDGLEDYCRFQGCILVPC